MDVLNINGLVKKYKEFTCVDKVDMKVKEKDIYGFVGPNGAGKTTIIRMICGLTSVTDGKFSLFGVSSDDKRITEERSKISAIVESPSIYKNLNAYDNLKMQCMICGESENNIIPILEKIGLDSVDKKKKVKDYSLGMRQRLGIGLALISNPKFLILDEPMNGLDPEGIVKVRELLLKLNKEDGITILISSHNLSELEKIATTYGIINHGKIIKEITEEELKSVCKKYLEIRVSNVKALEEVLKDNKIVNYKIFDDKVNIYDNIQINDLLKVIINNNINIKSINVVEDGIEDYYLRLLGGKNE